jgi:serine protease Do
MRTRRIRWPAYMAVSSALGLCLHGAIAQCECSADVAAEAESPPAECQPVNFSAIKAAFTKSLEALLESGAPVELDALRDALKEDAVCQLDTIRPSGPSRKASELYRRHRDSVVIVGRIYKCGKCDKWHSSMASGFVIGANGVIVTNYHVLDGEQKGRAIGVMLRDGRMLMVTEVLASSKREDLVVLKVNADDLTPLAIAPKVDVGTEIYCISHPVEQFFTITEGIVAGDFVRKDGRHEIAVTCDYAKGSSGAPILDATGAVVGIVRVTSGVYYEKKDGVPSKLQMVWKYCVPASALLGLLDSSADE